MALLGLSDTAVISSLDRSALLSVCLPGCCVSCCWTAVAPPESLTFCSCPNSIPPTILHLCTARRHLPSSACVTHSPALLSSAPLRCFPLLASGRLLNSLQRHSLIKIPTRRCYVKPLLMPVPSFSSLIVPSSQHCLFLILFFKPNCRPSSCPTANFSVFFCLSLRLL